MKTLRCKREGRRWYVIVVAEQQPAPLPATGREIGLDVGIAWFVTTSDGQVVRNPRSGLRSRVSCRSAADRRRLPGRVG